MPRAALLFGPVAAAATLACGTAALAQTPTRPTANWITLGTQAGPIPSAGRSQPANLLSVGVGHILVDAGDGAAEQLAKVGVGLGAIDAVVLSHLHYDHVGGLGALIGLRYQIGRMAPLRIIGPPGTRELVAGLVAALTPVARIDAGQAAGRAAPEATVAVEEISDGARIAIGPVTLTAAANSHYPASAAPSASLSYRFDTPGRTIVYTGDTGPSAAVERLANGADLLISEMLDADAQVAALKRNAVPIPPDRIAEIAGFIARHHLSPEQVGVLAAKAGVKRVVVTHIGPGSLDRQVLASYRRRIASAYAGPIAIAADLERF